jgi:hypothetical protein
LCLLEHGRRNHFWRYSSGLPLPALVFVCYVYTLCDTHICHFLLSWMYYALAQACASLPFETCLSARVTEAYAVVVCHHRVIKILPRLIVACGVGS